MAKIERTLAAMRSAPQTVRYAELKAVCEHYFGAPRQKGTSHCVFKTPWPGDPRVNIQSGKGGGVKVYQVRQVLAAIDHLAEAQARAKGKKE
ncbi:toxin HicA [Roseococcus sp. SYP-B2431]|uniref:toxin HicA n=1 Tax=Roseococcus sp. SYP-B2431 TaxID=2496640 RepID=UPI00103B35AF|nr:toxin HicA [Roseococcus sp. SYP-B2431]TCI00593.1 toxin HicA [Roseococcus sp. SYP-B2431]